MWGKTQSSDYVKEKHPFTMTNENLNIQFGTVNTLPSECHLKASLKIRLFFQFTNTINATLSTVISDNILNSKIKLKYNSINNYLYQNFWQSTGPDRDWSYVLKSSRSFSIVIEDSVEGTLHLSLSAQEFDDTVRIYRNDQLIADIKDFVPPYTDGYAGYPPISNYSGSYNFTLESNNTIKVEILNSGGNFYMKDFNVIYSYSWITK